MPSPTTHSKNGKVIFRHISATKAQKTVNGVLPLIYHAESRYAFEKQKGHLPSYLSNVALHMSATCRYMCKVSKLGHALTLEPFELERHVNQVQTVRKV